MQYNFDKLIDRRLSECVKWNAFEADVLPMWVADMDFESPRSVTEALEARVEHGFFGYPLLSDDLRGLVVDWIASQYRWEIQPTDLVFVPGVVTGFNLACQTLRGRPGSVLLQPPIYPPMLKAPLQASLDRKDALLMQTAGGEYQVDWDRFERSFDLTTRMFLFCNPHNPTGRVFRQEELERLAQACLQRGVLICSDEIHCDLVYSGHRHIPIASLDPEIARNSITLMAPSKTFNLAGLKFAFAVIPDAGLRQSYQGVGWGLVNHLNLMGICAAQAAYEAGQDWLRQLLIYLEENRDTLLQFVRSRLPGVKMGLPEGTYLAWLDCRQLELPEDPYHFFLKNAQVALGDGETFGPGGEGFVRLNFGCPRQVLLEALERMESALQSAAALDE
jgi:cystathionine beta-lyase